MNVLKVTFSGILWEIGVVFFLLFFAVITAPFVFVIMGLASAIKYTLMGLVFFWDMAFSTNYHYKFFKEQ